MLNISFLGLFLFFVWWFLTDLIPIISGLFFFFAYCFMGWWKFVESLSIFSFCFLWICDDGVFVWLIMWYKDFMWLLIWRNPSSCWFDLLLRSFFTLLEILLVALLFMIIVIYKCNYSFTVCFPRKEKENDISKEKNNLH